MPRKSIFCTIPCSTKKNEKKKENDGECRSLARPWKMLKRMRTRRRCWKEARMTYSIRSMRISSQRSINKNQYKRTKLSTMIDMASSKMKMVSWYQDAWLVPESSSWMPSLNKNWKNNSWNANLPRNRGSMKRSSTENTETQKMRKHSKRTQALPPQW